MSGNKPDASDVSDAGFVDAAELQSTGTAAFRSGVAIVDIVGGVITFDPAVLLFGYDDPVEVGDTIEIAGNAAAGSYTLATLPSYTTATVVEAIPDAGAGSASFRHPAGAARVGVDPALTGGATTVQGALVSALTAIEIGNAVLTEEGGLVYIEDGNDVCLVTREP